MASAARGPADANRYASTAISVDGPAAAPSRARTTKNLLVSGNGICQHARARQCPFGHGAANKQGRHNIRLDRSAVSKIRMFTCSTLAPGQSWR